MRINSYSCKNSNTTNKSTSTFKKLVLLVVIVAATCYPTLAQPPAPVAASADNIACISFNANWGSSPGAVAYYLDISTSLSFSSFVGIYNNYNVGNVLTYNITGINVSLDYFYRVRASDGSNTSLNSNTILTNTGLSTSPYALLANSITCTSFNASWNAVPGATSYKIDVSTSASFSTFIAGYNDYSAGNTTTTNISGLTANTSYYYRIRALNGCTTSINSNTITVSTGVPIAPVALASDNLTCTSANANWSAVSGASHYFIDVSTDAGFTTFLGLYNNLNVSNVTTTNITGLLSNVTYYYRVRSSNSCATSLNSNTISFNTNSSIGAPTASSATNTGCSMTNANWNASSNATAYFLDVATDATFTGLVAGYNNLNVGNVLTYPVSGLMVNTTYFYRVRSSGGCAVSANSNTITFTTTGSANPFSPNALPPSNLNCTSLTANWTSVPGAISYFIDVSLNSSFASFVTGYNNLSVGNVLNANITGLALYTTYYYRVRAMDGCGTSLNSNSISFSATGADAPVAQNPTFVTCTSFDANWTASTGALNYYLDVSTDVNFSTFIGIYNNLNIGNVTTYNVTGLTVSNTYYYRIRAINSCSTSPSSNAITALTTAPGAPVATTGTNITCSSFNANWNAVSGTINYYLDVSTSVSFSNFLTGYNNLNAGNTTTLNITGLGLNATYYYRVRAANGCSTSTSSNTITITTAAAATLSSTLAPPAICSGTTFNYTPTSSTSGATFAWTRAAVAGISNSAGSGSGNPSEILINTTASSVNVSYVYTISANGCTNPTTYSVTVPVHPSPTLSSTLTPPAICNGTTFSYTPTSATSGATFTWTRAAVAGISNAAGSGSGNPNETLTNTTSAAVNVTYVYTLAANGCSNPTSYNVLVSVNATPTLSSTLTPSAICSGTTFNYTPTSATSGATFTWTRATVVGISNAAGSGSGDPNEVLTNTTSAAVNVTYVYTLAANGCSNPTSYNVLVSVNATPTLSSTLTPPAICSGTTFNYTPTSATSGATFAWTRAVVAGISNAAGSGSGDPNEILTNTTSAAVNVTYVYTLAANGCSNPTSYSVSVSVNASPTLSSTLTPPAICSGTVFSYTPTSATSGATFAWTRAVVAGISNAAGSGSGDPNETLTNSTSSAVNVTYVYTLAANGCGNPNTYSVVVAVNPAPELSSTLAPPAIFTNHIFSYTPTSGTTGTSFSWVRAAVSGISNIAGSGTGDPNEALFNTSTNPLNVTYVYSLSANGCTNPTSYNVVVTVNTAAVWPGDANNDSLVNNVDLLSIGLYYSQTGMARSSVDNTFQAYVAANWLTLQNNGQDIKHADSNGDGTINSDDTLAINLNFNLTHTIVAPPSNNYYQERATSDMYFVINSSAYSAGDWVNVELWLGSQATPLSNLYGIAFDIDYESALAQSGTEVITYGPSWLGTPGTDVLTINQVDALANKAYGAITRNDQVGRTGYGKIADFKFQVKSTVSSADTMHFSISSYMAIDSAGNSRTLATGTDSITVDITTGIKTAIEQIKAVVSPNPFNTNTSISLNAEIKDGTAKVFDVLGKEVKAVTFTGKQVNLERGELPSGIYSVKILSGQKIVVATEKIIIQ